MRALLILLIVFGSLPFILARPYVGVVVWSWISYMNPHRLVWWSFVYTMPIAAIVGGTTLLAYAISAEPKRIPLNRVTVVWMLFAVWMCVTTVFALNEPGAYQGWDRDFKIQIMALVALAMLTNRQRLDMLVWMIVMSIGFYGVKGGLFAIRTGGHYLLWGPPDSFIEGNNELALAMLVIMPLMRYLQLQTKNRWIRYGLALAMGLSAIAVLTSYSRGALLAACAIAVFLWWKSRHRTALGVGMLAIAIAGLAFMPHQWFDRMSTIDTYQSDASAMGRINAWHFAVNLALDHPITGGGFNTFTRALFARYAPNPTDFHDAHSIYFQVLGEHGFVGLALFLLLALFAWRTGTRVIRQARDRADLRWAQDLAAMIQVSLVGYAVGGTFLGLAYFDLPYNLIGILVATRVLVDRRITEGANVEAESWLEALRPVPFRRRRPGHGPEKGPRAIASARAEGERQ